MLGAHHEAASYQGLQDIDHELDRVEEGRALSESVHGTASIECEVLGREREGGWRVEQHALNGTVAWIGDTHRGRKQEHERVAGEEADVQPPAGSFLMVAGQETPDPVCVGGEEGRI